MMNRKIGTDAVKLTISQIITMCLSLVNTMLLSRFRSLEEYGTYSQLLITASLLLSVFMLGIPNSFNFFIVRAETEESRTKFVNQYYTLITLLSSLTGVVLICSREFMIEYFDNPFIERFVFFLALFPWASAMIGTLDYFLVFFNKVSLLFCYKVSNGIVLLSIVMIVQRLHLGFYTYMFLFVSTEAIFAVLVYLIAGKTAGRMRFIWDIHLIKSILDFSVPLGFSAVIGTTNIELDKLLIGKLYNTKELAIYTNAAKEMPVSIISSSISTVLLPVLAVFIKEKKTKKVIELWSHATIVSYAFICYIATVLIVYAPVVMTILYSEKYLAGIQIFRIYSLLLLFRCTYFGMLLNAMGRTKIVMKCTALSLVINFTLNIVFYYLIGFHGPAVATLLSVAILSILQLAYTAEYLKISFLKVFPWKDMLLLTVINMGFGVFFYLVEESGICSVIIENVIIRTIVCGIIWSFIYVLAIGKYIKNNWDLLNGR